MNAYRKANLISLAILSVVLALVLSLLTPHFEMLDLSVYWSATYHFIGGLNPYNLPHQSTYAANSMANDAAGYLAHTEIQASDPLLRVWTPPYIFTLLWPLGLFPLDLARKAFLFFVYFSTFFSLVTCVAVYGRSNLVRLALAACAALPLGLLYEGLAIGSVATIALLGLSLSIYFVRSDAMFLAGLCVVLTAIKAHLFLLLYFALLLWVLRHRNWRFIGGFFCGLLLLVTLPVLFRPEVYQLYLEAPEMDLPAKITNASWTNFLSNFLPLPRSLAIAALSSVGMALTFYAKKWWNYWHYHEIVAALLPFSLIFSPFAWSHDYIVCLPFFVMTASRAEKLMFDSQRILGSALLSGLLVWQICDVARAKLHMVGYFALFGSISLLPILATASIWFRFLQDHSRVLDKDGGSQA